MLRLLRLSLLPMLMPRRAIMIIAAAIDMLMRHADAAITPI